MKVRAIWEFDVDVDDFDTRSVDIKGLAEDLTKREMESLLKNKELQAEDFSYEAEATNKTKKISFEIEHYDGDTYLAFMLKIENDGSVEIAKTSECSHADTDGDYIFGTDNDLIRIQADKPI